MKLQLFLFVKFTPKCALCIRYVQQSLSKTKGPLTFFLIYLNNSHIAAEKKSQYRVELSAWQKLSVRVVSIHNLQLFLEKCVRAQNFETITSQNNGKQWRLFG